MRLHFEIIDDERVILRGDIEGYTALKEALESKLKLRDHLHLTLVCPIEGIIPRNLLEIATPEEN